MAPPKDKYTQPILYATSNAMDFRDIMAALETRVNDTAWTTVYKALCVVHLMIQQGEKYVTLEYLADNMEFFELRKISHSTKWNNEDMKALDRYNQYLKLKCKEFVDLHVDYVKDGFPSMSSQNHSSVRRRLDHVDSLEIQIRALIKNRYSVVDLQNELLYYAFKLLVTDLLALYNTLNEGVISLLETFFELDKSEAKRTLELYKNFVDLTTYVVKYLKTGKAVGLKIPVIKHITTKLIKSLEDHLNDSTTFHSENGTRNAATMVHDSKEENNASSQPEVQRTNSQSLAQQKLEQVREQKRQLEQQLQNQQVLISPTIPQEQYSPFNLGQQQQMHEATFTGMDAFSFEAQATGNPFMTSLQQQSQTQPLPQSQNLAAVPGNMQFQSSIPNTMDPSQTGFFSSNTQFTPTYTGQGFGGYSAENTAMQHVQNSQLEQHTTQPLQNSHSYSRRNSNNPFAIENIGRIPTRTHSGALNPFSEPIMESPQENTILQQQQMSTTGGGMPVNAFQNMGTNSTGMPMVQVPTNDPQIVQLQMQQQQQQQQMQQQMQSQQQHAYTDPNLINI